MAARINADGWMGGALAVPSPNCDARPPDTLVELLVIHNISLPPGRFGGDAVRRLFTNRLDAAAHPAFAEVAAMRVSAHFFIDRRGRLTQFVSTAMRAWHAGRSRWRGRDNCNDFSIGIELEGTDALPFTERQYRRLAPLVRAICAEHPAITARSMVGHSDIAPGRKTDPGPHFDWPRCRAMADGCGG